MTKSQFPNGKGRHLTPEQYARVCEANKGKGKTHPKWGFQKSKRVSKKSRLNRIEELQAQGDDIPQPS